MPNNSNLPLGEEKKKKYDVAYWISFAIAFVICSLFTVGIILYEYYGLERADDLYLCLVDGFSLSGTLFILFYLMMILSSYGAFDLISYSCQLVFYTMFHSDTRDSKLTKNFAEYRELKRGKEKGTFNFLLFVGLLFLLVGTLLRIPYSQAHNFAIISIAF